MTTTGETTGEPAAETVGEPTYAPMPGAEDLAEPLRSRWSPSVFDDAHTLSPDEMATLLHAARWSPSSGNSQPWAFVVAERGSASHAALVGQLSRGNVGWVPRASVVLVTATQVAPDPADPEGGGKAGRSGVYAFYDLGQAAAHVTLQARAMGLHTHQFAGFDKDALAAALGVPPHFQLVSGIAIGRRGDPADVSDSDRSREQKERVRKPLSSFVHGAAWGEPWPAGESADESAGGLA